MALIKIFNSDDKLYTSNGNLAIQPLKCIETKYEGFNGWEVDIELPADYKEFIAQDSIVVVPTKSKGEQPFRVQNPEVTTRLVKFKATHVAFDASRYMIEDVYPQNLNGASFLDWLNTRTDRTSPFTTLSDVSTLGTARIIRKTLMEAFIVAQERLGGFFDFNKWQISLVSSLGLDRGETIRYGKNLQGIRVYENWNNVCTKILPVGPDGITLPEVYLTSDVQYSEVYAKAINFNIQPNEGETLSEEQILTELRAMAQAHLNVYKYPEIRFEISADVNQNLDVGDTVYVVTKQVEVPTKVQGYVYDVNKKRVTKLIYGNFNTNVKRIFSSIKTGIEQALVSGADANKLVADQSNIIDQLGKLGHVYQDDNEIMVLDAQPKENAQNVLRINIGGIGFSSTGIEGPFTSAWTLDGMFNASFIQTGILNANLIKAGSLQSENGVTTINMNDGTFSFALGKIEYDGTVFTVRAASGDTLDEIADIIPTKANQTTLEEIESSVNNFITITPTQEEFNGLMNDLINYKTLLDNESISLENAKAEISELLARTATLEKDLGDTVEKWIFLDTYMVAGEEGLYIGAADGSAGIRVGIDTTTGEGRIDFLDGDGDPVAYITNQVMRINRGIFVDSAQIGEHKIETIDNGITIWTWIPS